MNLSGAACLYSTRIATPPVVNRLERDRFRNGVLPKTVPWNLGSGIWCHHTPRVVDLILTPQRNQVYEILNDDRSSCWYCPAAKLGVVWLQLRMRILVSHDRVLSYLSESDFREWTPKILGIRRFLRS